MKRTVILLVAMALVGCSQSSASRLPLAPAAADQPGSPPAPTPGSGSLWVMVVGEGGGCLADAKVDVLGGPRVGLSVSQVTPCGVWDYGGGVVLSDLTPGVEVTLRASAPGYVARELTVTPTPQIVPIVLDRTE